MFRKRLQKFLTIFTMLAMLGSLFPVASFATTPVLSNISVTEVDKDSALIHYNISDTDPFDSQIYMLPLLASATAPANADAIVAHADVQSGFAFDDSDFEVLELDPNTAYKVYITLMSPDEIFSTVHSVSLTTEVAPIISSGTASNITLTGATLNFSSNMAGTYSYVLQLASEDDISDSDSVLVPADEEDQTGAVTTGANQIVLTDLVQNTDYEAFVIIQDADYYPSNILKISFNTTPIVTPILSGVEVSADAKTIFVYSDVNLKEQVDESKISLVTGTATLTADKFVTTVENSRIIKIAVSTAIKSGAKLTLNAGVVKSEATSDNSVAVSEKTLAFTTKFPSKLKAPVVSEENKTIVLEIDKGSLTNPDIKIGGQFNQSLIDATQIAYDGKTYEPLPYGASVSFDEATDKVTILLAESIGGNKVKVNLAAGALRLIGANNSVLNSALTSATLELIPIGIEETLSPDNKTVSVKYSEPIKNVSTNKATAADDLKAKIQFAEDGENFVNLTSADKVAIKADTLMITFDKALADGYNELFVGAEAVMDSKNNKAPRYESAQIIADEVEPALQGVGFKASDKTLTLIFDENIFLNGTTTLASLASAIKYNADLALTSPTASISGNKLIIKHKTTGITTTGDGGITTVKIPASTLRDAALNPTLEIISGAPDVTAPTAENYFLSNDNKDIMIRFSENIYSVAKTIPLSAVTISTVSGQSEVKAPISAAAWKTPTTNVKIIDGHYLLIQNLKTPLQLENKITINKDILTDVVLNKNVMVQFTLYYSIDEGIDIVELADGAYAEVQDILNRIRELAVEATDASLPSGDRAAIQAEVSALISELNLIATTTSFNSIVLHGSTPYTLKIATGALGSAPTTHTFTSMTPTALGVSTLNVSSSGSALTSIDTVDAALDAVTTARIAAGNLVGDLYDILEAP